MYKCTLVDFSFQREKYYESALLKKISFQLHLHEQYMLFLWTNKNIVMLATKKRVFISTLLIN